MKMKRFISFFLSICLVVALVPAALATESFTINGVTVTVSSGTSQNNCAAYASSILKRLWTVKPGQVMTTYNCQYNLLRERSAADRSVTESHVKEFIQTTPLGSRIRICSQSDTKSNDYDNSSRGHTMVLVARNDSAGKFTVLEGNQGGIAKVNVYTYKEFVSIKTTPNKYRNFGYNYFYYINDYSAAERDYKNGTSTGATQVTPSQPTTPSPPTTYVTITFDPNGGSVSPNTQKIVKGSDPSNLPTPTRRGYTFKGWMFDKIDPDNPPLSSSGVIISENSAWGFEEDTTLYAFWVKDAVSKQYTVTLDDGSTCKQISVTGGGTYSNLTTPAKDDYTFDGWYTAEVGGTKITTSTKVNLTGDQTLYAHWTPISIETTPSKPEPPVPPSSHSHSGSFKYAESSHPHLNHYTCSTCGEDYTDGSTTPDKKCDQCWGPWSVWSYTPAYRSETRQVESQHTETQVKTVEGYTEYRYGGYATSDGKHECWCDTYLRNKFGSANLRYSDWSKTRYSENGKGWSCGQCSGNHIHVGHYDNNGNAWWPEYTLPGGKNYYWEETRTVPDQYETRTETVYRYRDWTHG